VIDESERSASDGATSPVDETSRAKADDSRASRGPTRDLDNDHLDPLATTAYDPESWDERPEHDEGADRYAAEKPPHHGD
jgi:hypothetical protein